MGIVDTAKNYINNVVYVFGANDVKNGRGDCSSFVQQVYADNGISIGRDTESQWTGKGEKISISDLQSGDLIFFKNTYNSGKTDGVSHVGIYEGNGKFIHNSSSKGTVVESSLDSEYWQMHLLGAKRITENDNESTENTGDKVKSETVTSLTWWGDIVNIVLITLLCVGGVGMGILAVKFS